MGCLEASTKTASSDTQHRFASRLVNDMDQELMELELVNTKTWDRDISEKRNSPDEDHGHGEPQSEPAPAPAYSSRGSATLEVGDAMSYCTKDSFKAIPLKQDPDKGARIKAPGRDDALHDQTRVDHVSLRVFPEFEAATTSNIGGPRRQRELVEFITGEERHRKSRND